MKAVHKYPIDHNCVNRGLLELEIPVHADILKVGLQGGQIMLWALIDTTFPMTTRPVVVFGTGIPLPKETKYMDYLDTVFMDWMVFHVWVGRDRVAVPDDSGSNL